MTPSMRFMYADNFPLEELASLSMSLHSGNSPYLSPGGHPMS